MDHKAGVNTLARGSVYAHACVCARALGWSEDKLWMQKPRCLCCRKGDPFQDPRVYSCLTLRNESSEETHVLTKHAILLEKRHPGREQEGKGNPAGLLYHMALSLGFYGDGVSFWVVSSHSL